jgi:hypothetical protein
MSMLNLPKKYKNDLKQSLWNDSDVNSFLIKLKKLCEKSVKIIQKKIKQVDKKVNEKYTYTIDFNTYISIPQLFDRKNYLDFYYFDPIHKIFNDIKEFNL